MAQEITSPASRPVYEPPCARDLSSFIVIGGVEPDSICYPLGSHPQQSCNTGLFPGWIGCNPGTTPYTACWTGSYNTTS